MQSWGFSYCRDGIYSRVWLRNTNPGWRNPISVAQSCLTLCDPTDCSTSGFPVHHQLLELTQTHVHLIGDAIQPSHLLSSPSPSAFNLSQHQDLFKWVSSSHQFNSVAQSCPTLCNPMNRSTPGFPVHHQLLEFTQTHVHWVGDAIQPSHPLSSLSPAFNLSSIRVFSNESVLCIRWPKYWSFSFSITPSNEYSGLLSFRMDWLNLFAVQGTLKSLQYHS